MRAWPIISARTWAAAVVAARRHDVRVDEGFVPVMERLPTAAQNLALGVAYRAVLN